MNPQELGKMISIDGCPVDCAKKLMEKNGILNCEFIRVTDSGLEKAVVRQLKKI